jgi:hypothetical protein
MVNILPLVKKCLPAQASGLRGTWRGPIFYHVFPSLEYGPVIGRNLRVSAEAKEVLTKMQQNPLPPVTELERMNAAISKTRSSVPPGGTFRQHHFRPGWKVSAIRTCPVPGLVQPRQGNPSTFQSFFVFCEVSGRSWRNKWFFILVLQAWSP